VEIEEKEGEKTWVGREEGEEGQREDLWGGLEGRVKERKRIEGRRN
jgi:hypothetical protein